MTSLCKKRIARTASALNIVITLQRNVASRLLQRRRTCCVPPPRPAAPAPCRHCPQSKNPLLSQAHIEPTDGTGDVAGGLDKQYKHFNARIVTRRFGAMALRLSRSALTRSKKAVYQHLLVVGTEFPYTLKELMCDFTKLSNEAISRFLSCIKTKRLSRRAGQRMSVRLQPYRARAAC